MVRRGSKDCRHLGDCSRATHSETMLRCCLAGLGMKNALPGKWDDCTLNADQTPINLGISNGVVALCSPIPHVAIQILGK